MKTSALRKQKKKSGGSSINVFSEQKNVSSQITKDYDRIKEPVFILNVDCNHDCLNHDCLNHDCLVGRFKTAVFMRCARLSARNRRS